MQLQTNEQSWTRVDAILENSANQNAKFFALQILEDTIKYRWLTLPGGEDGPREGVKNYVVTKIIALSQDEDTVKRERVFLSKMNLILVQVRGGGERGRERGRERARWGMGSVGGGGYSVCVCVCARGDMWCCAEGTRGVLFIVLFTKKKGHLISWVTGARRERGRERERFVSYNCRSCRYAW